MDAIGKLRMVYPNLMKLDYDNQRVRAQAHYDEIEAVEQKRPEDVVAEFYQMINGAPLSKAQKKLTEESMGKVREEEQ